MFKPMFTVFASLFVLFMAALPALAQAGSDVPAESPGFAALLAFSVPVFAMVELVKPTLNAAQVRYAWSDNVHQFVVRVAAFFAALLLLFITPETASFVAAFDLTLQVSPLADAIITALAVSAGSAGLYALQTFLRPRTDVVVVEPVDTGSSVDNALAQNDTFRIY